MKNFCNAKVLIFFQQKISVNLVMLWHYGASPCCGIMEQVRVVALWSKSVLWHYGASPCCGTMEQVHVTEGTLNTLNFNKKEFGYEVIKQVMN